jgi:prepilin-type N-terminal cleavage/methylation domain-containing protein
MHGLRSHLHRVLPRRLDEGGFTLIEMTIAIALSTVIFTGLAFTMGSALRTMELQKARTLANEVATQGIEDLQRFPYSSLGLCAAPTRPNGLAAPTGFSTVITLNCTNASVEEPCTPTTFSPALTAPPVPKESYVCKRSNIAFTVSRYVAWGDATQTGKRLAVVIDWTDRVGAHQVSQQSSLRAPDAAAIIGVAPPAFSSAFPPTANPSTAWVDSNGYIVTSTGAPNSLTLSATTTGLSSTDQVFANIMGLDPATNAPIVQQFQLTSTDGSNWSGTVPGLGSPTAPKIGSGSQYVSYTLVRVTDGKANSTFTAPANKFCSNPSAANTGGGCSISGTIPTISGTASPLTIPLDPDSTMQAGNNLGITATTSNTTVSDSVTVSIQTLSGAAQIALKPDASCSTSPGSVCNSWSTTITPSAGYRFPAGSQKLYFAVQQVIGSAPDIGSTAATQSTFSVAFT